MEALATPLQGLAAETACPASVVYDAIILAGGRATRLDGHSKPDLEIAGWRMLELTCGAAGQAQDIVVVGPSGLAVPAGAHRTQEKPAHGGPVAGISAGLARLAELHRVRAASPLSRLAHPPEGYRIPAPDLVLVLACDVPLVAPAIPRLVQATTAVLDGAHLIDDEGRAQWLAGCYRRQALLDRLDEMERGRGFRNAPVHRFVEGLRLDGVPARDDESLDVDTWPDHHRLQLLARALQ